MRGWKVLNWISIKYMKIAFNVSPSVLVDRSDGISWFQIGQPCKFCPLIGLIWHVLLPWFLLVAYLSSVWSVHKELVPYNIINPNFLIFIWYFNDINPPQTCTIQNVGFEIWLFAWYTKAQYSISNIFISSVKWS